MKGVPFVPKMVYRRVRDQTSGWGLPVLNFFSTPPPPSPGFPNLHRQLGSSTEAHLRFYNQLQAVWKSDEKPFSSA